MKKNIFSLLNKSKKNDFIKFEEKLNDIYTYAPTDFGGGCSLQKALVLGFSIKTYDVKCSLDIGVYRGRSLFPQSISHKEYTNGIVYAVDPFDSKAAIQNDSPDLKLELDKFVNDTNFDEIFKNVKAITERFGLQNNTTFVRERSHDAYELFKNNKFNFGLVHIDGNHDREFVLQDVYDYLPLLTDNGVVVLDDISWNSVKPAFDYLNENITLVGKCIDTQNDFAVFSKSSKISELKKIKNILESVCCSEPSIRNKFKF